MGRPSFKSKEDKKNLIEDWQASGLSIRKWCQQVQIPQSRFHQWKNKLLPVKKTVPNAFVELPEEKVTDIQLEYKGVKIYLSKGFDENLLSECFQVIRRLPC